MLKLTNNYKNSNIINDSIIYHKHILFENIISYIKSYNLLSYLKLSIDHKDLYIFNKCLQYFKHVLLIENIIDEIIKIDNSILNDKIDVYEVHEKNILPYIKHMKNKDFIERLLFIIVDTNFYIDVKSYIKLFLYNENIFLSLKSKFLLDNKKYGLINRMMLNLNDSKLVKSLFNLLELNFLEDNILYHKISFYIIYIY